MNTKVCSKIFSCSVVGTLNLDRYIYENGAVVNRIGGMAMNAWIALHSRGRDAGLVASIGSDEVAEELIKKMRGLDTNNLEIIVNPLSASGLAEYRVAKGCAELISLRLQPTLGLVNLRKTIASRVPVLAMGTCIDDLVLLDQNRPLFWNPGPGILKQGETARWPRADILFVNIEEWHTYLTNDGPTPLMTVITKHAEGSEVLMSDEVVAQVDSTIRVSGIDVGAGDHFAGIFTDCFLSGADPQACLNRATNETERFLFWRKEKWQID
jgi:sugar/nucleoside kinase (ribokinase family)